ncbi:MAG: transcription factor [Rubrivivax sp.]|nr:MAG: transcription factor [Rubrivivax sp.]
MKVSASRARIPLPAEDALERLGSRISRARRARLLTQADLASKSGLSLSTMAAIEAGSPTVQIGFYLSVLFALDALQGLDLVATLKEDETTLERLSNDLLPKRVRR